MTIPEPFPATIPAPGIPAVMALRLRPGRAAELAVIRRLVCLTDRRDGFHVTVLTELPPVPGALYPCGRAADDACGRKFCTTHV